MEVKLGDFGLATKLDFDGEKKRTICGTPNYIAPEVLEGNAGHSYEVDIWSLGVIIYTLIIGKPPFETNDVKTTYRRIRSNQYAFPTNVPISEEALNLICGILSHDPLSRPNLNQILQHPWLNNCNIPKALPPSLLACPPTTQYLKQYLPPDQIKTKTQQQRMMQNSAPQKKNLKGQQVQQQKGVLQPQLATQNLQQQQVLNSERRTTAQHQQNPPATNTRPASEPKNKPAIMVPQQRPKTACGQKGRAFQEMMNAVYVIQWIDYSNKYGLGYLLSDKSAGVFFNDSTKMLQAYNSNSFNYYERQVISNLEKQDVLSQFLLDDFPQELQKKLTLLYHFKKHLEQQYAQVTQDQTAFQQENFSPQIQNGANVYVKKWMLTRHAIMFRLSNKIMQVNFMDKTQILLNSESRMVTYANKKQERRTLPLNEALESQNAEMTKRLKYTKDILTHMLNTNQKQQQQQQLAASNLPTYPASQRGNSQPRSNNNYQHHQNHQYPETDQQAAANYIPNSERVFADQRNPSQRVLNVVPQQQMAYPQEDFRA